MRGEEPDLLPGVDSAAGTETTEELCLRRKYDGFIFSRTPLQLREEMRAANARQLLPGAPAGRVRRVRTRVAPHISGAIYQSPYHLRKFAERVRDGALGTAASWVYFIESDVSNAVKIGVSNNPQRRLADIASGWPDALRLLGAINGDTTLERLLHGAFSPDRIRGEWFRKSPTLAEFIRVALMPAVYKDG